MKVSRTVLHLAVGVASLLALPAPAARAGQIAGGCATEWAADPTDPQDRVHVGVTRSYFVGTPDVAEFRITCWLQTERSLATAAEGRPTDLGSYTDPRPDMEIPNTRHTCWDRGPAGVCANPVVFQKAASDEVYQCTHVVWWDAGMSNPQDLAEHFLADVFQTRGVTTMGSVSDVIAAVEIAVSGLVATLDFGTTTMHERWYDYDTAPGMQCSQLG